MNILGSNYKLIHDYMLSEDGLDGCCNAYSKQIKIQTVENMLNVKDRYEEKQKRYNEVLRHEIIHAFFNESGLDEYSDDEVFVNWIAVQFPKIFKVFKECHCLD